MGSAYRADVHFQFFVPAVITVGKRKVYSLIESHFHGAPYQYTDGFHIIIQGVPYILDLSAIEQIPKYGFAVLLFNRCNFFGYMAVKAVADIGSVRYARDNPIFLPELLNLKTAETLYSGSVVKTKI